jgi:hypothetical protein
MADDNTRVNEAAARAGVDPNAPLTIGGGSSTKEPLKPGQTKHELTGQGYVVPWIVNQHGQWEIDTRFPINQILPGKEPTAANPHTLTTNEGILQWMPQPGHPAGGQWVKVGEPPTAQRNAQFVTHGDTLYQVGPDGTLQPAVTNTVAQAERAQNSQRQAAQDTRANNSDLRAAYAQLMQADQAQMQNLIQAGQLEESAGQNEFNRRWKSFVELPYMQANQERETEQARYQAAQQRGSYETGRFNAARGAGQQEVDTLMATLPYKINPQFVQEFAARRAQEGQGQALTPYSAESFLFRAPDLAGARAQGQAQANAALPGYDQLLAQTPALPGISPEEAERLRRMLLDLPYQP